MSDENLPLFRPEQAGSAYDRRARVLTVPSERRVAERRFTTRAVLQERRGRESTDSVRYALPISRPTRRLALENLHAGLPFVAAEGNRAVGYVVIKRIVDIAGAAALLALLSPIMLVVLATLTLTTGGRPLFVQRRVGYLGRPFRMFKFRTMRPNAEQLRNFVVNEQDGPIFKNRRDPRITRLGRLLRASSIDELPQLVNVLQGDMSLVGPRPPIAEEVAEYEPWQRRRLAVRPGLTCLWQISGRSEIGFEDWVRMDLWYVRNQTLKNDAKLLLKTPYSVLTGRGAY